MMSFCLSWIIFSVSLSLIWCQNISVPEQLTLVTAIIKLIQSDVTLAKNSSSTFATTSKPLSWLSDENYWLKTVILVPNWIDVNAQNFRDDIQKRFVKVIELAVERQQAKRYQLPEGQQQENGVKENVQVQVLNITREGTSNRVAIIYAVTFNGYYIGAYSLSDDLKLINSNEFSAVMGYPVQQIQSYISPAQTEKQNWWIIGAVIGSTVGVLMCGWCLLFVYYNTCGRAFHPDEMDTKKVHKHQERPSSPVLNTSNENEPREPGKIYLISTDVQTDANDDEELIRSTQPRNWMVPQINRPSSTNRHPSLQLSSSLDNNQGVAQISNNQVQKPFALPTNSATTANNKNAQRRGSYMNGLNSPPASKSDSVGSITLKTNEEMQTIGIYIDQEQKSADLRFAVDHSTFGGVSGMINANSPLTSYGIGPSRIEDSNATEDIWKLYPFQRYQAADNVHRLTEQLTSDHPRPGPSSAYGEIIMHSKEFHPKRVEPAALSRVFGLI